MKRWLVRIAIALAVVFLAIQVAPVDRENPPETTPLVAEKAVTDILVRSCYDCHSNKTVWPWYSYVAPVSWLVAHDVKEGREHLNFSHWGDKNANWRMSKAEEMLEEIEEGEMPLANYLTVHSDAKLSPADVATLRKWVDNLE